MRQWGRAESLYERLVEVNKSRGNEKAVALAYHQLGIVAQERRDFEAAEQWYRKSLETTKRLGDEHGAAATQYQLGTVQEEQGDSVGAVRAYVHCLRVFETNNDQRSFGIVLRGIARASRAASAENQKTIRHILSDADFPSEVLDQLFASG